MNPVVYRYCFDSDINLDSVEGLLVTSITSIEHLHGESAARLDARYLLDEAQRRCVIDATTPIGVELNKLFAGELAREFGPDSFRVERVPQTPQCAPAMVGV